MRRPSHPDIVTGLDTTSRLDRPYGAEPRVTEAGPSYVQSVLFARRPTRGPTPGRGPVAQATAGDRLVPATSKKGTEPCAS